MVNLMPVLKKSCLNSQLRAVMKKSPHNSTILTL